MEILVRCPLDCNMLETNDAVGRGRKASPPRHSLDKVEYPMQVPVSQNIKLVLLKRLPTLLLLSNVHKGHKNER